MSQVEFQKTIFNIYTSEILRNEFLASPEKILAKRALTDRETAALLNLSQEHLTAFSNSLSEKKRLMLKKMLKFNPKLIVVFSAYLNGPALFIQNLDAIKKYSISMKQFNLIKNLPGLSIDIGGLFKAYIGSKESGILDLLKISFLANREKLWNRKIRIL